MFSGKLFRRRTIAAAAVVVLLASAAIMIRTRASVEVTHVPFSDVLIHGTVLAPATVTLQRTSATTKTISISQAGSIRIQ